MDYVFVKTEEDVRVVVVVEKKNRSERVFYKGQTYRITGEAQYFESASNPGQFDERKYNRSLDVAYCLWADEIFSISCMVC